MTICLVTGKPGIGKTTLIRKFCEENKEKCEKGLIKGFYTLEVRDTFTSDRIGFDIITLDGNKEELASTKISTGPSVGKYRVNVKALDDVIDKIFQPFLNGSGAECLGHHRTILVIDEIGKMEMCSQKFRTSMEVLFTLAKLYEDWLSILATIPFISSDNFINGARCNPDNKIILFTMANRNQVYEEIKNIMDE